MEHFADRLATAAQAKGTCLCVGLDPRWELLPQEVRDRHAAGTPEAAASAYEDFCGRVIDLVAPLVPAVKPQCAFFEACGPKGMEVLQRLLRRAREQSLLTILDGKRNDIASTATAYADAAFGGVMLEGRRYPIWDADALTVNPYLGRDAIEPFLSSARRDARGVFVLVRTSNAGSGQFQDLDGGGRPLYLRVAEAVGGWGRENLGRCGFGDVGAVVGATGPAELAAVRQTLTDAVFLVPGFGAQGGSAADTAGAFREDGLGAIVNSSKSVLFPFRPEARDWESQIEQAVRVAIANLAEATPAGRLLTAGL